MNNDNIRLSVDRIENDIAVCISDFGETVNIPISLINGDISEGKVLIKSESGGYFVDDDETKARRKANFELSESLFDE